jgi:hypothetical protein
MVFYLSPIYDSPYNFISAKGKFCKAELYLWSNRKGGILNLSGPAGSAEAYAYGHIREIRLEGNSKPPLEYKDPAAAIAAYVATTLGKSLKTTGPAG